MRREGVPALRLALAFAPCGDRMSKRRGTRGRPAFLNANDVAYTPGFEVLAVSVPSSRFMIS